MVRYEYWFQERMRSGFFCLKNVLALFFHPAHCDDGETDQTNNQTSNLKTRIKESTATFIGIK